MRRWVWVLALAGVFAFQHREGIRDWIQPPQPIAVPAGFQAVLYSTATCPYCAKTRQLLQARHVPYRDIDVDKSDKGFEEFQRLGGQGVPVLVINRRVIHGYDRAAIEQALAEL